MQPRRIGETQLEYQGKIGDLSKNGGIGVDAWRDFHLSVAELRDAQSDPQWIAYKEHVKTWDSPETRAYYPEGRLVAIYSWVPPVNGPGDTGWILMHCDPDSINEATEMVERITRGLQTQNLDIVWAERDDDA